MIKDKIKALITVTGHTQSELAEKQGISRQQLNLKITRNAFRIDDLIELAELTGTTLAFVDDQGEIVMKFDKNDIAAKEKE